MKTVETSKAITREMVDEKARELVQREVYACQSMLVEELLQKEIISYDDIQYPNRFEIEGREFTEEEKEKLESLLNGLRDSLEVLQSDVEQFVDEKNVELSRLEELIS